MGEFNIASPNVQTPIGSLQRKDRLNMAVEPQTPILSQYNNYESQLQNGSIKSPIVFSGFGTGPSIMS